MDLHDFPKITFTMTTYQRLQLFLRTMESFMSTCMDRDLIQEWIICDDGSSDRDLETMKNKYPFLTIIRNPGAGQASSINHLFSKVRTMYFFHCEDDWLFRIPDHYIRKCMSVMFHDPYIRNVTLRYWETGIAEMTSDGIEYYLHKYDPTVPKEDGFKTNSWWYGYTLNPGLQHKPTVDELGKYDESDTCKRHWDKKQAKIYLLKGYKTANLTAPYIEHLGDGCSAYKIRMRG